MFIYNYFIKINKIFYFILFTENIFDMFCKGFISSPWGGNNTYCIS